MFLKFKDIFTIGTIMCGFLVLLFASIGNFQIASYMILIGFILDSFDGLYSRLTKTWNEFGAEFDRIADLIIYSMAPAILLFFIYWDFNIYFAYLVGLSPLIFGSLRLARYNLKRKEYPGFWFGFPRPASAIAITALVNSSIFLKFELWIPGAIFVFFLGIMNLTLIPYAGHHGRKINTVQKLSIISFLIFLIISFLVNFIWYFLLTTSLIYLISPLFYKPLKGRKGKTNFYSGVLL